MYQKKSKLLGLLVIESSKGMLVMRLEVDTSESTWFHVINLSKYQIPIKFLNEINNFLAF